MALILSDTGALLRVVTGSTGTIECHVSWIEVDNAVPPVVQDVQGDTIAVISTATTTTILACAANRKRNVKHLNIFNDHATTSNAIEINHTDGTNSTTLWKGTLLAQESVVLDQSGRWTLYDINGNVKAAISPVAAQAEMEAATSNTLFVTPLNLNWHPGVAKFWCIFTGNSTTVLASWNLTSITDGTTEATVTIATDFSSANWCCLATAIGAATSVTGARLSCARALAAGTAIVFCTDANATPVLADPTSWCVMGLGDQ